MPNAVRSFGEGLRSVRAARRFLEETLRAWSVSGFEFGATLVVTELATNAVLFATPPFWVRLSFDSSELRVEVHDNSARLPRRRNYGLEATTGRGLNLVVALCEDWGVTTNNAGKMVWATVRADDEATVDSFVDRGEEPTAPSRPKQAEVRAGPARSFADSTVDRGLTA